jgi:hypothetical protein
MGDPVPKGFVGSNPTPSILWGMKSITFEPLFFTRRRSGAKKGLEKRKTQPNSSVEEFGCLVGMREECPNSAREKSAVEAENTRAPADAERIRYHCVY